MFPALTLILRKKQKFGKLNFIECNSIEHINRRKKTNIYYSYNDQIDLKDFNARLLKIEIKDYNEIESINGGKKTENGKDF